MLACIQRRQNLSSQHLACTPKSLDVPPPPLLLSVPPLQPCTRKGEFISHRWRRFAREDKQQVLFTDSLKWKTLVSYRTLVMSLSINHVQLDLVASKRTERSRMVLEVCWGFSSPETSRIKITAFLMMMMMLVNWATNQHAPAVQMHTGQSGLWNYIELINSPIQGY